MADGSVTIAFDGDTKNLEKDINSVEGKVKSGFSKIGNIAGKALTGVTAVVGTVATGLAAAATAAVNFGTEYQKASNKIMVATGSNMYEMEELNEVLKNVYANNFGESMDDVANAISTITQQVKNLDPENLQTLTEYAIGLRDAFGYDVSESIRSAKALMDNFGVSGEEAYSLIAQGAQKGLDYSGEFLDNINEYSVQFGKLGLSAEDMFNIFASGAESGAFNLDKIGDAVKEFSIRAIDGSETTIEGFTLLGLNADEMAKKFANGGETAKQAFFEVIQRIGEMDDKVQQSIVGVDLFGTMWEDLGPEVVTQLGSVKDAFDQTYDSMEDINLIQYDDFGSAIQGIGRNLQTNLLLPISEQALPLLNELANGLNEAFSGGEIDTEKLAETISNFILGLSEKFQESAPQFLELALQLIENLINGFIENLPMMMEMGMQLISQLIIGIAEMLPQLIPQAINCILTIIEGLLDNIDLLIDAALQLIIGLAEGLINAIPVLIEKAPVIIIKLVEAILKLGPKLLDAGVELIIKLASGIGKSLTKATESAGKVAQEVWNVIKELPGKMIDIGKDIVTGIWNGISGMASWLWDQISGWCQGIFDGIKNFFGIHSPSKLFSDEIGRYLALGVGEGFDDNIDKVYKQMKSAVDFETQKLSTSLSTSGNYSKTLVANIQVQPGDIIMDSEKVGRVVAPAVTRTFKGAGAY